MTTNLGIQSFSPTQTDAYAFRPRYWGFSRAGLKPKCIGYPEMAAITGTAVAKGLEAYYNFAKQRRSFINGEHEVVLRAAMNTALEQRLAALANGQRYVSAADQDKCDAMDSNVELLLKTPAKTDPFKGYDVV